MSDSGDFIPGLPGDELLYEWAELSEQGILPPHWSPAQVKLVRKCAEQYRQRYVLGIRTPPMKALLWGNAHHAAIGHNLIQKIETEADLPMAEVLDAFRTAVDLEISAADGEINWGGDDASKAKAEVVDDGTRLVGLYHAELAPSVQPLAVEDPVELTLPGIPVPMKARVDVREQHRLIDSKTTSSSKGSKVTPENMLQGRIYTVATRLPTAFHLAVKPSRPGGQVAVRDSDAKSGIPFVVGMDATTMRTTLLAVRRTLQEIVMCAKVYGPDNPWPDALAHDWSCSYCGFRDQGLCYYWGGKSS